MQNEQRLRGILFYLSVTIFLLGLPFILSFALGYKFNPHTLKFTKAGLIVLKTQPSGANVYLNQELLNTKTPTTIAELLPGKYLIRLELERHYPWFNEINVEAGKVTRLEKVILFPLRSHIKQLNKERLSSFWIDEEKEIIYYINAEDDSIYKSDLEGAHLEKITNFLGIHPPAVKLKVSPDREKLLYFNAHQIGIARLQPQKKLSGEPSFVLDCKDETIVDVFWHSDNYHLILVRDKSIEALEAQASARPVILVNLNKKSTFCSYDTRTDTLYFLDSQKAADGNMYDNLYKLELNSRAFPFQELIKLKADE